MQFQQERERALSHIFRAISRSIYEYSRIEDNDPKVLLLWLLVSNSDGDPVTYFPNQKLILIYKKKSIWTFLLITETLFCSSCFFDSFMKNNNNFFKFYIWSDPGSVGKIVGDPIGAKQVRIRLDPQHWFPRNFLFYDRKQVLCMQIYSLHETFP